MILRGDGGQARFPRLSSTQLIHAKLKAGNYLLRVRDDRRRLLRTLREAKAGRLAAPCVRPSGGATPQQRQA